MPQKRRNLFPGKKWCPHCEQYMTVDEFGLDKSRDDGLSGWCRPCRARDEKRRRDVDLPKTRTETNARYERDPRRFKAHVYVARAIASGKITKPTECPVCRRARKIEAHHFKGYERKNWLEVVWRCRQCHALEHKRSERAKREAAA